MSFLNPIALWGLLALLIPLVIHFLSKKQQNVIYFGSNKFLESKETTSARSIQLSDLLLLLIRAFLLATLVFAISKLSSKQTKKNKQVYIEAQIANSKDYNSLISDATLEDLEINYFTHDKAQKSNEVFYFPSSYTLINHLNGIHDSIIVYSHSLAHNFKGSAVGLNQDIEWKTVPYMSKSMGQELNNIPLKLDIICAEASENHLEDFKQVLASLKQHLSFDLSYQTGGDWKIYIDTLNLEFNNNLNQIHWQTSHPTFSFEKDFDGYSMEGSMSKKAFLESNFPIELAQALINSRTEQSSNKTEIHQPTYHIVDPETVKAGATRAQKSYTPYLWLVAILLLLIERIYSLRKEAA